MLNLSTLFFTSAEEKDALFDNLGLSIIEKKRLESARVEVRNCLREGIPAVLRNKGFEGEIPKPRFFTQGSWSYKTLNAPAVYPQQADLDDGVYLPMTFVTQTKRPSKASQIFFSAAEEALHPLAKRNNWVLITDKATCIRIEISKFAHIDVPLYAIPDTEFAKLKKAMDSLGIENFSESVARRELDVWTTLPRDQVLLAHREENWKKSDPRPLRDWFIGEIEAKGEQLRRVVRYLKAYRDWQWKEGGPTSILLMAAAAPLFKAIHGRDDLALLGVVKGMAISLRNGVANPTDSTESLTARLGSEKVENAALAFEDFERYLQAAIDCTNPSQACTWMIKNFGNRFPDEPTWIKSATVAATISAIAPVAGASELVGRTKAA